MSANDEKIYLWLASALMDVTGHLAKLEFETNDLKWRICHHRDLYISAANAKKHCRNLLDALQSVERCLQEEEDASGNVVSIEEQRKKT